MHYGIYKGIRESAWQCFDDFGIDRLPVDIVKIAHGSDVHIVKNSIVNILSMGENGKTFFDGIQWIIVYEDRNPVPLSRYTVAHELGHIFLGHELVYGKYAGVNEFVAKPKSEQQADAFALRVLCPACVLWGLDLQSAEDIEKYCRVPYDVAKRRSKRMETLYKRGKFLTSNQEERAFERFSIYIQDILWERENKKM